MKNKNPTRTMSPAAASYCKRTVYLLSLAASLLLVILSLVYQALGANFGAGALGVNIYYYFTQIISVCVFFALASISIYTYFAGNYQAFAHSLLMNGLSCVFVSVLLNTLLIWLLAFLDDITDLPFEISNNTLTILNDGGLIYLMSMSFISVLSLFLVMLVSLLIMRPLRKKYTKNFIDLSFEALAGKKEGENPLKIPMALFAGCFAVISFIFQALDTFNTVAEMGAPTDLSQYVYLLTPFIMLVIYTLAGYFVMQYFTGIFANKILEKSRI